MPRHDSHASSIERSDLSKISSILSFVYFTGREVLLDEKDQQILNFTELRGRNFGFDSFFTRRFAESMGMSNEFQNRVYIRNVSSRSKSNPPD